MTKEGLVRVVRKKDDDGLKTIVAKQDQAEILDEVGAKRDEETGELLVDEERIQEIGAVDVDAVRENRRMKEFNNKKRGGVKGVSFNTDDVLQRYELLTAQWPPNTIDISMRRLTGAPAQYMITSRPRNGVELYDALMSKHGVHVEADYELKFIDSTRKEYRAIGRITLPDTRPQTPAAPAYPPAPPNGYAPQGAPQDMSGMVATVQQMFEMFRSMQPQPQPTPAAAPPPPPPQYPPPPSTPDPQAQLDWVRQVFELYQRTQPSVQPAQPAPAQPAPAAAPPLMNPMLAVPPTQPPPGMIWVPGFGYVPVDRLMQAISPPQERRPPSRFRPRDDREPFDDPRGDPRGYDRHPGDPRGYDRPRDRFQPPPPPKSPTEEFRDAVNVVRTAMQTLKEVESILPGAGARRGGFGPPPAPVAPDDDDDDSPVQIVEAGGAKMVFDREGKEMRWAETIGANVPDIMRWAGEQMQALSKNAAERQATLPRQALPEGFVEVGPGYKPPPGFVAVPVTPPQQSQPLPQPPSPDQMPPPLRQPQPGWGGPPSFQGEDE